MKTIAQLVEEAVAARLDATIGDVVERLIAESGVEQAVGVEIETSDGATTNAQTDEHPIMDAPASQLVSAKIKQSAEAGAVN